MTGELRTPGGKGATARMTLGYHGRTFYGWGDNPGLPTVEGTVRAALEKVLRHDVVVHVAGRTDRGVHAAAQVASFVTDAPHFDPVLLTSAINKLCRPAISIAEIVEVDSDFHARFSAVSRSYQYRVQNAFVADALRCDHVWHVPSPLDLDAMNHAAALTVGLHDFRAFCRVAPGKTRDEPMYRRVMAAEWSVVGDELVLNIVANAFCTQMVRSLTAAMVGIGRDIEGHKPMETLLQETTRSITPAPPHGLTLTSVEYPDWSSS
jgi:tRNA pseudouridine38-40 synthase